MLQYKVPQNVGIEDRIVGPLTLRQLIILTVGFSTSYVLFAILVKIYELNILEYIVILIPAVLALAAALVRINDITFTKFIILATEYSIKPKRRVWDHRAIAPLVAPVLEIKKDSTKENIPAKATKPVNLEALGKILDSGGFENVKAPEHQDLDKASDDRLIAQAFFGNSKDDKETMYWRTMDSHKERLKVMAKLPPTPVKKAEVPKTEAKPAPAAVAQKPAPAPTAPVPAPAKKTEAPKAETPKPKTEPVRPNKQVNTLAMTKQEPAKFVPKAPTPAAPIPPAPAKKPEAPKAEAPKTEAPKAELRKAEAPKAETPKSETPKDEWTFEELKKGEIEINLP